MLRNAFGYGIAREWVDLDQICAGARRAVIASEDARFFEHHGIDWPAVERARAYNARHGDEAAPRRRHDHDAVRAERVPVAGGRAGAEDLEAGLAYAIGPSGETAHPRECTLNVIEWGPGVHGAEAAARVDFRTTAARLDPHQAGVARGRAS